MRIQGVVDNNVYPPLMGHTARVWNLYKGLARQPGVGAVRVVSAIKSRERAEAREERDGVSIVRVKPWHPTVFAWLEKAELAPLFLAAEGHRRFAQPFSRAWDRRADVFEVDSLLLTPLLAKAPRSALRVYGSQNVEAEMFERAAPPVLNRPLWQKRLETLEKEALAAADLVVAVSAADKDVFVARYGTPPARVAVVDNGFDAEGLREPTASEKQGARDALGLDTGEKGLLFVGTGVEHNRRAVEDLFRVVVPRLGRLGARLWIVGEVSEAFRARAESEGDARVRALPTQSDLTPYLWGSDVGLNPVTTGAGSNVKLPTYLAAGLDVLTTPFGARGFDGLRAHLAVAEIDAFADALARPFPSRAGRAHELARYAWGEQARRLHEAFLAAGARAR
jgi:glycosyltransferase involved in cell wall biosynthesis